MLSLLAVASELVAASEAERREYRAHLRAILPDSPAWTEWLDRTGELPPDFDALPKVNGLPDPFRFVDGRRVDSRAGWDARRGEIRRLYEQYVVGSLPPKPVLARVVPGEETGARGYRTRVVRLEYGPGGRASTQVTLTIPDGAGPFPVLIGGWPAACVRRGYIAASFSGSVDQPSNLPELFPGHDFASMGERAWTVQVVVDYLLTVPEVDGARIALTGYSREGKMATIAAAFDERIAAVIAGSTGVGGVLAWRQGSERNQGESIESTTRMFPRWFHPRLRFFSGREDRLPVDANLLVALIAPRSCLIQYGLNDEVSNTWGSEQTFHSAAQVYRWLGQPDRIGLLRVPGFHGANDPERCLDWLDIQFGRSDRTWGNRLMFAWDYGKWEQREGRSGPAPPPRPANVAARSRAEWEQLVAQTRQAVDWVMGEAPPEYVAPPGARRGFVPRGPQATPTKPVANPGQLGPDVPAWVIGRGGQEFGWLEPAKNEVDSRRIRFGNGVTGDLYFPAGTAAEARLPAVVWLHGESHPLGYMWVYRRDLHPILALVKAGYAVLAYDQCGFGARMDEIGPFYDRYPRWSQLGRLVADARAAVDALGQEPMVDPERIHLFGYTLGGAVALHAAALDARVRGVVAICGFTPMRTDTPERGTGGIARWSQERPLAPRLGRFIGRESDLPYDYDALLAALAPRTVLVVQPRFDRGVAAGDVAEAVERARGAYQAHGAGDRLALHAPPDYARFTTAMQDAAIAWMREHFSPGRTEATKDTP